MSIAEQVRSWLDGHSPVEFPSFADAARACIDDQDLDAKEDTIRRYISKFSQKEQEEAEEPPDKSPALDYLTRDYYYNEHDQVYVIDVDHRPETIILPAEKAQEMKEAYSNWTGDTSTINEICRAYGVSRRDFKAIKTRFGWTHDSPPLTDEQIVDESRPIDAKVEDLARQKEREIERRWQKKQWKETEKKAKKYEQLERSALEPIFRRVKATPVDDKSHEYDRDQLDDFVYAPNPVDAHLDQHNYDQSGFEANKARWLGAFQTNLRRVQQLGQPSKVVVPLANDQFNVDQSYSTTAGTPQQNDLVGPESVFRVADAGVELIEMAREVAPVEVRLIPGNHDWRVAWAYHWGLQREYADVEEVTIAGGAEKWQFDLHGSNLCVWTHGDKVTGGETKRNDWLSSLIMNQARELVSDSTHTYVFIGHLHHIAEKDHGVHVMQGGSTAKIDEWSSNEGHVSSSACQVGHVLADSGGAVVRFTAYCED